MIKVIIPTLGEMSTFVSLAPKIKTAMINQLTVRKNPVIRMIPKAPPLVNEGYNPLTFGPGCPVQVRKTIIDLLAPLGTMPEVAEGTLEAYAVITPWDLPISGSSSPNSLFSVNRSDSHRMKQTGRFFP